MTLKVEIYPKNLELTPHIADYITKKASKLDRYLSDIEETRVDLEFQKSMRNPADRQVAQITIRGRGYILRTQERSDDILTAFDTALDNLQRKMERYKGKRVRGRGDGTPASGVKEEAMEMETVEEETPPLITRRKTFTLVPMDEMEALEQMKALGHENFFVFYNINTNSVNVLYQRRDGTYGLIETRLG
ncbi:MULTISPECIES: ribosome hibernation-promoting factor, HPF/YfiA family [Anaerolinea]|uniref:ribosome hibernation-promoting factor, HPF/YfiA family n=1 Tax=Anaerolinea TaxID=233189 RepID=UPI00262E1E4B|nr:ribosome-associated translation inhibitor RaiA [Anaerolinea thermophila]